MVLKLQAKVVPFDEVHVGAHQVKQHLAWGFLLQTGEKQQEQRRLLVKITLVCTSLPPASWQRAVSIFCCWAFVVSDSIRVTFHILLKTKDTQTSGNLADKKEQRHKKGLSFVHMSNPVAVNVT